MLRSTVEALAADERAKRHNSLADQLTRALQFSPPSPTPITPALPNQSNGKDFLLEVTPRRTLASLILEANTRRVVEEVVEEQLRADLLRSHGLQPRHRILLAGPPGNGKTSLAEAIADALAVPFFAVRYDQLVGSYLGETTQRLRRLFDYVRTTPCVLLFDEFDVVGKERSDPQETGEIKRVVSTLLLQIDALPTYVTIIAATNHEELLDRAAWRRFEVRLRLPPPGPKELACFFEQALGSLHPSDVKVRTWSGSLIARRLGAVSYAEARDFCLDVSRRYVLSLNQKNFSDLVAEQIEIWSERVEGARNADRPNKASTKVGASPRKKANRTRKKTPVSS
ncbi:ATP-binding protein [Bradyrhizobium sp. SZCCHNPS2010]|uniref:AAA family ATPase n=1 Tax=Bradyrhizobium sp. SZCCHNPS2010 TaxID=3057333 RepID=UPI0029161380|nr:ATP-binding protein [Bradyrhizobium sp. SZCCHNPS2010]